MRTTSTQYNPSAICVYPVLMVNFLRGQHFEFTNGASLSFSYGQVPNAYFLGTWSSCWFVDDRQG